MEDKLLSEWFPEEMVQDQTALCDVDSISGSPTEYMKLEKNLL